MIAVAKGLYNYQKYYILIKKPIGCHLCRTVYNKGLTNSNKDSTNNHKEIPLIDHSIEASTSHIQSWSHQKTKSQSLGIDDMIGRKIHEWIDEEGYSNRGIGISIWWLVHSRQFCCNWDDRIVSHTVDDTHYTNETDNSPSVGILMKFVIAHTFGVEVLLIYSFSLHNIILK